MLRANARRLAQMSLYRIPDDSEVMWSEVRAYVACVAQETTVDRGEPCFGDFAAFGFDRIELGTIPELPRAEVSRNTANPMLHVIPAQT
jgi:hypothetical protein